MLEIFNGGLRTLMVLHTDVMLSCAKMELLLDQQQKLSPKDTKMCVFSVQIVSLVLQKICLEVVYMHTHIWIVLTVCSTAETDDGPAGG